MHRASGDPIEASASTAVNVAMDPQQPKPRSPVTLDPDAITAGPTVVGVDLGSLGCAVQTRPADRLHHDRRKPGTDHALPQRRRI